MPIDVELISDSTNAALRMELSTSTREAIDTRTTVIIGQLNLLLGEELGADDDPEVKGVFRKAHQLLDLSSRPTRQTPSFSAFFYMRDVASLTRRLLWVYAERTGTDVA
ncbi:hypothetical protein [Streptomyces swartbergensis]|uniref:hypothetical protein n=1 Tax=Streptomyces swartbergensis TaxID=487165 RepID=UPI001FCA1696|nr:hypothetical protein [Streptomyces swartbergensis]